MLRFIHTSDWHLGATLREGSIEEEQRQFLGWLIEEIRASEADVLVVAGDVFHQRNPSNRAEKLYYDFLVACERKTALKKIVVVGGNHDSPSKLEAPGQLLEHLSVKVVGTVWADRESWRALLVPVQDQTGAVLGVVAAVPYVSEARLGISGVGKDAEEIGREFRARFGELYRYVCDVAREQYGEVPLVATGHLTVYGNQAPEEGDFHSQIHQIGTIEAMPPAIFDERIDYVALGHIHRMFPIREAGRPAKAEARIWYSGTPVPTAFTELSPRFVLLVEIEEAGAALRVEKRQVPRFRDLFTLQGSTEEALVQAAQVVATRELAPYVYVRLENREREPGTEVVREIERVLRERLGEEKGARIVDFREILVRAPGEEHSAAPLELEEMEMEEVFADLYRRKYGVEEVPAEILQAFRELRVHEEDSEWEAMQTAWPLVDEV